MSVTLPSVPQNWDSLQAHCQVKHADWWFYSLAFFVAPSGTILTHEAIKGLANHTAVVLNHTRHTIALVSDDVTQMRQVVLQNRVALDLLTATQGSTYAILHTECCV